jgi:hypothetical protein
MRPRGGRGDSFVGGFSVSYPRSPLAKYRFTWPLARLTLAAHDLQLSPRLPLRLLMKPIVVPYTEISLVDARGGRRIGTLVFHCKRPDLDGIGFGTWTSHLDRLLALLEGKGVPVDRGDST